MDLGLISCWPVKVERETKAGREFPQTTDRRDRDEKRGKVGGYPPGPNAAESWGMKKQSFTSR